MKTHPWHRGTPARGLFVLALAAACGTGARGTETLPAPADDDFAALPTLAAEELQALRGGFEIAGLKFDFAAELRTFVDGRLALETLITYTQNGPVAQHLPMSRPVPGTQPTPTSLAVPAPTSAPLADESVQVLGPGQDRTPAQLYLPSIDLSGLKEAAGILVNDRKGTTLALHEATRERITSTVLSQAIGRDIRQELNVSVTVQNFQQFRDSLRSSILNSRLNAPPR